MAQRSRPGVSVEYIPAEEDEASGEVETCCGGEQASHGHPLAEAHNDARVLVLRQLAHRALELLGLGVAQDRVLLGDADVGAFRQLPERLDPALTVVLCQQQVNSVLRELTRPKHSLVVPKC